MTPFKKKINDRLFFVSRYVITAYHNLFNIKSIVTYIQRSPHTTQ